MDKGRKNLPLSGLVIQVSLRCTRSRTSENPSRQGAVKSNLKIGFRNENNYSISRDRSRVDFSS